MFGRVLLICCLSLPIPGRGSPWDVPEVPFPRERPTLKNIRGICKNLGKYSPIAPEVYRYNSLEITRRAKTNAALDELYRECCYTMTGADEVICAIEKWDIVLDAHCDEEKAYGGPTQGCCKKQGTPRSYCFDDYATVGSF